MNVASSSNIFGIDTNMQGDLQESVTQAHLQDQREEEARRIREEQERQRREQIATTMWRNKIPEHVLRDFERAIRAREDGYISNELFARYASVYDSHFNQWKQYYIDHVR
jgi:hypothetical protein